MISENTVTLLLLLNGNTFFSLTCPLNTGKKLWKCISREKSILPKTPCYVGQLMLTSVQKMSSARGSQADSWDGQVRADKTLNSGLTGFDKSKNSNLGDYIYEDITKMLGVMCDDTGF